MDEKTTFTFVNTQVPMALDRALRLAAAQQGVSRSDIVRKALEEFLKARGTVVGVEELPRPEGAEGVPVVLVVKDR